jgi:hypothetical protein
VHHEFLHQEQTANYCYYLEVLKHLREYVRRKRPQLWRKNFWFLHHDNVPAHASLLIRDLVWEIRKSHLELGQVSRVLKKDSYVRVSQKVTNQ